MSGQKEARKKLLELAGKSDEIKKSIPYKLEELAKEPELLKKLVVGMCKYAGNNDIFGGDRYEDYRGVGVQYFLTSIATKNNLMSRKVARKKLLELAGKSDEIKKSIPYKLEELAKEPQLLQKLVFGMSKYTAKKDIFGGVGHEDYRGIDVQNFLTSVARRNKLSGYKEARKKLLELLGKSDEIKKSIPHKLKELAKEPRLLQKLVYGICNYGLKKDIFGRENYEGYRGVEVQNFLKSVAKNNNLKGIVEPREKLLELAIKIGIKIDDIQFLNCKLENALRDNNDANIAIDREKIKQMIALFGEGCSADILFRYFPEYAKMDIKQTKKIIKKYLGNIQKSHKAYLDPKILEELEILLTREEELANDVVLQRSICQSEVWRRYKRICKNKKWEKIDHAWVMDGLEKLEGWRLERGEDVNCEELEKKWREWSESQGSVAMVIEHAQAIWELWKEVQRELKEKKLMFHQELEEVIRRDCFDHWRRHKNKYGEPSEHLQLILDYLRDKYQGELQTIRYERADKLVGEVEKYYRELFEIVMPEGVVRSLKVGRNFPDMVQLFNIKELEKKKRLLIADEMGLGKSASAILSREYLLASGLLERSKKATLIIVPANMIKFGTWQRYLSKKSEGGYFEAGYAPMENDRVLVVNGMGHKNLNKEELMKYDYVIISHEKMGNGYTQMLKRGDWGMVIVDEVHQFKNVKRGKRSAELQDLIDGCNQNNPDLYLALLSGTPIPNRVSDIAMILKLLYPLDEKIAGLSNVELVEHIINGDLQDIRSLLVNKMQRKRLVENIEITKLCAQTEHGLRVREEDDDSLMVERIGGWDNEKEGWRYESLLEMDGKSGSQKIRLLNKFLLNPSLLQFAGEEEKLNTRMRHLQQWLEMAFVDKDKVVVFVNQFISGVMRDGKTGDDLSELGLVENGRNIFNKVTPEGVEVLTYHGLVGDEERLHIQGEFMKGTGKKLLVVSGNTAAVGVDFSAGEAVYFYSLPWSMADLKQQLARVYREGIGHDLEYCIPMIEGTIDEGIWRHLQEKEKVIDNLTNGIPLDEMEKKLARDMEYKNEMSDKHLTTIKDEEVANLVVTYTGAKKYLKNRYKFFKGKDNSEELLAVCHDRYAKSYRKLMYRSYQANASRAVGSILQKMMVERGEQEQEIRIIDMGSGPKMLRDRITDDLGKRMLSLDSNPKHFSGRDLESGEAVVASMLDSGLPAESADYLNYNFCYHYVSTGNKEKLFREANRLLKIGGRMIINQIFTSDLDNYDGFAEEIKKLGFGLVEGYTQSLEARNKNNNLSYASKIVVLEKITGIDDNVEIDGFMLDDKEINKGMELVDDSEPMNEFFFGDGEKGESMKTSISRGDRMMLKNYERIDLIIKNLVRIYGKAKNIPLEILYRHKVDRFIHEGKVYLMRMVFGRDMEMEISKDMFDRVKMLVTYQED